MDFSSIELVKKIRAGDKIAIKEIYERMLPAVKLYVIRDGGTEEEAKDVLTDSFMVLIEYLQKDGQLKSTPSTFLYGVSRNLWRKRKVSGRQSFLDDSDYNQFLAVFGEDGIQENEETNKILYECLDELSPRCKEILESRYLQGMTYEEIGFEMGFSGSQARKIAFNCVNRLRNMMSHKMSHENG